MLDNYIKYPKEKALNFCYNAIANKELNNAFKINELIYLIKKIEEVE